MKSVVLLEDFDFVMKEKQLNLITKLHNDGMKISDISGRVKRNEYEVLLALLHQTYRGKITRTL